MFSGDGSLLVSGGWDGIVRIWNLAAGSPPVLLGHSGLGLVDSIALHPDGRFLAVGYSEGGLLWDVGASPPVSTPLPVSNRRLNGAAFAPAGGLLALVEGTEIVHVWDFADGRLERGRQVEVEAAHAIAFSPDDELIVGLGNGEVVAFDATTLDEKSRVTGSNRALAVASSSDGALVAAGGNEDAAGTGGLVDVWRVAEEGPTHLSVGGRILALAFEPRSHRLVSAGSEGILRVWDVDLVEPLVRRLTVSGSAIRDLSFTADGAQVVAGTLDGELALVDTGESPATTLLAPGAAEEINAIAVSGPHVFWADGVGHIGSWSLADGRAAPTRSRPAQVTAIAAASDGRILAAADEQGKVVWWNTAGSAPPTSLDTTGAGGDALGLVLRLRFSRRGDMLAAADNSGRVRIWNIPSGARLAEWKFHWTAIDLDFSPDGHRLVVADYDGEDLAVVRPARSGGVQTFAASCPQVSSIAFRNDGRMLVAGCKDGSVEMFAADGWASLGKLSLGENEVGALSASPTAGVVAAGTTAGEVFLLDVDEVSWARRACRIIDAGAGNGRPTQSPEARICTRLLQGAPPESSGLRHEGARPRRRAAGFPVA